jgi:protein SCO1/2
VKSHNLLFVGLGLALGLALVLGGAQVLRGPYQFKGTLIEPGRPIGPLTLADQHGREYVLGAADERLAVVFFGYTSCPDVCPTTLAEYRRVHDLLGERAQEVSFIFVTVDPERDTPERMGEYVARFNPAFIGLSGTEQELEPVWESFFVYREIDSHEPGDHYLVDHTSRTYVLDRDGLLRLTFPFGLEVEAMASDLRELLKG